MKTKHDAAWSICSKVIREAANYTCQLCGKTSRNGENGMMDGAHNRSRRHNWTRYDPRNIACLCRSCHMKTTEDPQAHVVFFREYFGDEIYELMLQRSYKAWKVPKNFKKEIKSFYDAEYARIMKMRNDGIVNKIRVQVPEILE